MFSEKQEIEITLFLCNIPQALLYFRLLTLSLNILHMLHTVMIYTRCSPKGEPNYI